MVTKYSFLTLCGNKYISLSGWLIYYLYYFIDLPNQSTQGEKRVPIIIRWEKAIRAKQRSLLFHFSGVRPYLPAPLPREKRSMSPETNLPSLGIAGVWEGQRQTETERGGGQGTASRLTSTNQLAGCEPRWGSWDGSCRAMAVFPRICLNLKEKGDKI